MCILDEGTEDTEMDVEWNSWRQLKLSLTNDLKLRAYTGDDEQER